MVLILFYSFYSLIESDWSDKIACEMMEIAWNCQTCEFSGTFSSLEKLQHINSCKSDDTQKNFKSSISQVKKKNSIAYECPECQKILYLAPTEILRHKRQHET